MKIEIYKVDIWLGWMGVFKRINGDSSLWFIMNYRLDDVFCELGDLSCLLR